MEHELPVDQHESMSFRDVEPLHGRKLMRPRRVCDLKCTDVFVATDHLTISVLNGRNIRVLECICHPFKWRTNRIKGSSNFVFIRQKMFTAD